MTAPDLLPPRIVGTIKDGRRSIARLTTTTPQSGGTRCGR